MDDDPFADDAEVAGTSSLLNIVEAGGVSLPVLLSGVAVTEPSLKVKDIEARIEERERNLTKEHVAHIRDDPFAFAQQLGAWAAGSGWRSYSKYIGAEIMVPGFSDNMRRDLLSSQAVRARIRDLAERRLRELPSMSPEQRQRALHKLEQQLADVAEGMAQELVARMDSIRFLRFFGATINQVLIRLYHQGINMNVNEFAVFRQCALRAAEKKQSLIFLPCHKSRGSSTYPRVALAQRHLTDIDYLTVSFLAFRLGLALPHIIAGENLNMPVVGEMLQKVGACFIRRTFGDDALYGTMVQEYIEQLLAKGHNLEVFIEGTRSRTGKLLAPKYGILSYIVGALLNGRTDDVWICPISLQYDRVVETQSYINELLGTPKEKESLAGLLGNSSLLKLQLGRVDVRFQKPWSLRAFVDEQRERRSASTSTEQGPAMDFANNRDHKSILLRAIGYRVLSDINEVAVIMPAALVGTVLLTLRGRGIGRSELIRKVDWLRGAIIERGGRVASFEGAATGVVVDRAIHSMRDLIGEHKNLVEKTFYALKRFQLSFYRNAVITIFISEAVLCAVLYTRVKQGGGALLQRMPLDDVMTELSWLSQLLASEFVYGTEGLASNANATIGDLEREHVLKVEDGYLGLAIEERLNGRERFDFSCFLLWPFIESYWVAAVSLFALAAPRADGGPLHVSWFGEKAFHANSHLLAKSLYYQGDISYLEAVNQATLSNALARFQELGMLLSRRDKSAKSVAMLALHPDWAPQRDARGEVKPEGRLWLFLERLGQFRREGKNRRDNGTVSSRVLAMVETVRPPVLEEVPLDMAKL